MLSIKGLASRLKLGTAQVAKDLTIKHRRKMFCKFDGTWYQFSANSEVIVPFKQARDYALTHSKKLPDLVGVNDLNYDHLNSKDQEKVPVVVLLGHFNHGKTTLLDSLCGTSYVDEEKHSITQTIRTKLVSTSATKRITIVDTPGQEVFYRMRSYGASIADTALLLVAADDGICQQTQESIGILEELGIPAIACINKIDLPAFVDTTKLDALEAELKEYVALSEAPIVRISAKDKLNFPTLLEKLEGIAYRTSPTRSSSVAQKPTRTIRGGRSRRQPVVPDNSEDTEILNIVSSGTILNIFKSRQQGVSLHVIVRSGELRVGDSFSAGGWCGTVRSISLTNTNDRSTLSNSADTATTSPSGKKKDKPKSKPTPAVPQVLNEPSVVCAGMAATILVALHPEAQDPRPIGDTIRFHRDTAVIRRDLKAKLIKEGLSGAPVAPTTSQELVKSTRGTIIQSDVKVIPKESFHLARDAAAYCMERNQLEIKLASYAVSPSDVTRFGLERLLLKFQKQKPGFHGEKTVQNRVLTMPQRNEDTDNEDSDSEGTSEVEDNAEEEEEVLPTEEEVENAPEVRTVIVKADSEITLGTLFDRYGDEEEAYKLAREAGGAATGPELTRVLQWGLGEVGLSDVNLASAGDAVIVAYNVGVERSAARQALNLNVPILKYDLLEDAANAIVDNQLHKDSQKRS